MSCCSKSLARSAGVVVAGTPILTSTRAPAARSSSTMLLCPEHVQNKACTLQAKWSRMETN